MYEVFDDFLIVPTWYTGHSTTDALFFRILSEIVDDPYFNAEAMAAYIRRKMDVPCDPEDHFSRRVDRLQAAASAVRCFLQVNGDRCGAGHRARPQSGTPADRAKGLPCTGAGCRSVPADPTATRGPFAFRPALLYNFIQSCCDPKNRRSRAA